MRFKQYREVYTDSEYASVYKFSERVRSYEDPNSVDSDKHGVWTNDVTPTQDEEAHHHDISVLDDRGVNGLVADSAAHVFVRERCAIV